MSNKCRSVQVSNMGTLTKLKYLCFLKKKKKKNCDWKDKFVLYDNNNAKEHITQMVVNQNISRLTSI